MSKNAALKRANFDITRALSDASIEAEIYRGMQPIRSDLTLG